MVAFESIAVLPDYGLWREGLTDKARIEQDGHGLGDKYPWAIRRWVIRGTSSKLGNRR